MPVAIPTTYHDNALLQQVLWFLHLHAPGTTSSSNQSSAKRSISGCLLLTNQYTAVTRSQSATSVFESTNNGLTTDFVLILNLPSAQEEKSLRQSIIDWRNRLLFDRSVNGASRLHCTSNLKTLFQTNANHSSTLSIAPSDNKNNNETRPSKVATTTTSTVENSTVSKALQTTIMSVLCTILIVCFLAAIALRIKSCVRRHSTSWRRYAGTATSRDDRSTPRVHFAYDIGDRGLLKQQVTLSAAPLGIDPTVVATGARPSQLKRPSSGGRKSLPFLHGSSPREGAGGVSTTRSIIRVEPEWSNSMSSSSIGWSETTASGSKVMCNGRPSLPINSDSRQRMLMLQDRYSNVVDVHRDQRRDTVSNLSRIVPGRRQAWSSYHQLARSKSLTQLETEI